MNEMSDRIIDSKNNGRLIFWEEVARDGAQSKTILSAKQRIEVAQLHASIFGDNSADHLIFAAGFPSVSKQEFQTIERLVNELDCCYFSTHGRPTKGDLLLGFNALKGAKYGRVTFLLPATEEMSQVILNKPLKESFKWGIELLKFAKDYDSDMPVDIALVDSPNADPIQLADFINNATLHGLSFAKVCDSRGVFYPQQVSQFLVALNAQLAEKTNVGVHFHNDFGLAMTNIIEALKLNVKLVASSWLGLGERSGLVPTEELLLTLGLDTAELGAKLGVMNSDKFFSEPVRTNKLRPVAKLVSSYTGVPIRSNDPVIGMGVNSISTGLPFRNPNQFQPFDSEKVLGAKKQVVITHMASKKVVEHVVEELGYELNDQQLIQLMDKVKSRPYETNKSIVSRDELSLWITSIIDEKDDVLLFGENVEGYHKFRPPYPDEMKESILSYVGDQRSLVLDIGAGTGISTKMWLADFKEVVALEPDKAMVETLKSEIQATNLSVVSDAAEMSKFKPDTIDLINCACSYHWLDTASFLEKSAVELREGGVLAISCVNIYPIFIEPLAALIEEEYKLRWKPFVHPKLDLLINSDRIISEIYESKRFEAVTQLNVDNVHHLNVDEVVGFIKTLSFFQTYLKSIDDPYDYLDELKIKIEGILGTGKHPVNFQVKLYLTKKVCDN